MARLTNSSNFFLRAGPRVGLLVVASLVTSCASSADEGGRSAPRDVETVTATLPGHEGTHFGGRAVLYLTGFPDRGEAGIEVRLTNPDATAGASVEGRFSLGAAGRLFLGDTIDVRGGDSSVGYAGPGSESGRGDPAAFGTVASMRLVLDEATATSTLTMALADEREIVVRGQILVACYVQDGGLRDDPRWESPFCAEQRASMNVEPFLAAMR